MHTLFSLSSQTTPYLLGLLILGLSACAEQPGTTAEQGTPVVSTSNQGPPDEFGDYWYQGKAELTSYKLEQARYGQIHEGHAVLVFVTEPFSKKKQVKLDYPAGAGQDEVTVLKLNFTKKFVTGIYPYSMMQSVFSPVELTQYPHALKTSMTAQEWCGHTFTQLNLEKEAYRLHGFSYFESEGDVQKELPLTWLEDEIWTRIRLNPADLPTGSLQMIPGSFFLRLKHHEFEAVKAEATLSTSEADAATQVYELSFPGYDRQLRIRFERAFPHRILGWEERYNGLTTKATRMEVLQDPYWQHNRKQDTALRARLGLP